MIEGAIIALVGVLIGRLLPNRRRTPKPPKAVCGCHHGIGYHENKTGRCSHENRTHIGYTSSGTSKYEIRPCTCQHYDGPIPVESMFSTPLLPPGEG